MEFFAEIRSGLQPLTIFTKSSVLEIRLCSEYTSIILLSLTLAILFYLEKKKKKGENWSYFVDFHLGTGRGKSFGNNRWGNIWLVQGDKLQKYSIFSLPVDLDSHLALPSGKNFKASHFPYLHMVHSKAT